MTDIMLLAAIVLVGFVAAAAVSWPFKRISGFTFMLAFLSSYVAVVAFLLTFDTWTYWHHGGHLALSSSWLGDLLSHVILKTPLLLTISFVALVAPAALARSRRHQAGV